MKPVGAFLYRWLERTCLATLLASKGIWIEKPWVVSKAYGSSRPGRVAGESLPGLAGTRHG